jgi:hypothetical protein
VIRLPVDVPVDPDAPTARHWLEQELAKAPYQQAKPSFFEQLVNDFSAWLDDLLRSLAGTDIPGLGNLLPLVLVVIVLALGVVAFLLFGVPRLNRRSRAAGELFGEDDARDAAALRRDALRAADAGDLTTAIAELFRSLARRLDERAIVSTFPGTTAHAFARRAGDAFPDAAARLDACAGDFDAVRYLGRAGTPEQWDRIVALEAQLRDERPLRIGALEELLEAPR